MPPVRIELAAQQYTALRKGWACWALRSARVGLLAGYCAPQGSGLLAAFAEGAGTLLHRRWRWFPVWHQGLRGTHAQMRFDPFPFHVAGRALLFAWELAGERAA